MPSEDEQAKQDTHSGERSAANRKGIVTECSEEDDPREY